MLLLIKPITNPVFVFTIFIGLLLLAPFISKRFNIPTIFSLIMGGLIVGPHGVGIVSDIDNIKILSTTGILYLMFLAGLEINLNSFLKTKNRSAFFGGLTFVIPLTIGFIIMHYVIKMPVVSSLLISSMFSSQTLISFPIASKLNITRRESVLITIGGTIITDTAVLILLSVITASHSGTLNGMYWFRLTGLIILFMGIVLWGFPFLARWFFNTVQSDSSSQYIFVLLIFSTSSMLAEIAGIEPIVGAFLAGLALNRVIPHHSPLMNRTVFIGNTIFIPFFLIGVGMLINLKVLFTGFEVILLALLFIIIALGAKYIVATITQNMFKYTRADRHLIFGLSASNAAATIAIALVGYELEIVSEMVLNSTILLILVTCTISSFVTEKAGRKIALEEAGEIQQLNYDSDHVLVPVANPASFEKLFGLALLTRQPSNETIIYPLSIITDGDDNEPTVSDNKKIMEDLIQQANATDSHVTPITRIDINVPTGITRVVKEMFINKIIMGWSGRSITANYFFGNIIDTLIDTTSIMVAVVKTNNTLFHYRTILLLIPENADKEIGFGGWVVSVIELSKNTGGELLFLSNLKTIESLKGRLKEYGKFTDKNFKVYESYPNFKTLPVTFDHRDLVVVIAARPSTISFNKRQLIIPKLISQFPDELNFVVVYPEQVEKPSASGPEFDKYFKI